MLGVVLSGGQSSRMGTDKGLIRFETGNWAQAAAQKLAVLGLPVIVSVNATQYDTYATFFPDTPLIKDNAAWQLNGPLLGIVTVHAAFPQQDLFVLACDMPLMEQAVLQQLLAAWNGSGKEACAFTRHDQPEPLCAIYSAAALGRILAQHLHQPLPCFSMKYLLVQLDAVYLPVQPQQEKAFRNFNAQAELNGM